MSTRQVRVDKRQRDVGRHPDDVWSKAVAKANSKGTTISAVIRGWLIEYINDEPHTPAA